MITCITFDDISPKLLSRNQINDFFNILNKFNIKCTLFTIPADIKNIQEKSENIINFLKTSVENGHEIGQHGYRHTGNSIKSEFGTLIPFPFPNYKIQKKIIKSGMDTIYDSIGLYPDGFRAPWYLHNKHTIDALSELNFLYDSSKSIFKPAHLSRIRIRSMNKIKPFKIKNIVEIPVTGDYTYFLTKENFITYLNKAISDFELVKSKDGIFVLNNHPNYSDIKYLFYFLKIFTKKISSRTKFLTIKKVLHTINKDIR